MTEQIKQKFEEALLKLPKEMQEVLASSNWDKKIEETSKKYNLLDEEINNLEIEASLVLLGLENPDSYLSNIETNVGLTTKEAENISKEIEKEVFEPIFEGFSKKMNLNIINEKEQEENWKSNVDFILNY